MMRKLLCLLLLAVASLSAYAQKARMQRVYIFGFAGSFTDSIAVQTDIQELDSAYLYSNGFLDSRSLYSAQLQQAVGQKYGDPNMACAVYFDKKKSRLEKRYLKLKHKYQRQNGVIIKPLRTDEFRFKAVEYISEEASQ